VRQVITPQTHPHPEDFSTPAPTSGPRTIYDWLTPDPGVDRPTGDLRRFYEIALLYGERDPIIIRNAIRLVDYADHLTATRGYDLEVVADLLLKGIVRERAPARSHRHAMRKLRQIWQLAITGLLSLPIIGQMAQKLRANRA
jgi:hypothetical protein